jgi:hypothetical protein
LFNCTCFLSLYAYRKPNPTPHEKWDAESKYMTFPDKHQLIIDGLPKN